MPELSLLFEKLYDRFLTGNNYREYIIVYAAHALVYVLMGGIVN